MGMTVGQANAVNALVGYLLGRRPTQYDSRGPVAEEEAQHAAEYLADRAYKTVLAGWTGERVRDAWRERGAALSGALRGPWRAVLSDSHGDLRESLDDFEHGEQVEIAVVRASAAPAGDRRPGTYYSSDVLYELDGWDIADETEQELAQRWEQAQAVAAALNALANPGGGQ